MAEYLLELVDLYDKIERFQSAIEAFDDAELLVSKATEDKDDPYLKQIKSRLDVFRPKVDALRNKVKEQK